VKKTKLPNTELIVSPICLGTMTFGTPVDEKKSIDLVSYAIENGVNFFDTANMYEGYSRTIGSAGGVAEEILGKALINKRAKVILATKVGMKVGENPEDEGTSPAAILKQLDRSLKRLNTDYIDIYYLHRHDSTALIGEMLLELKKAMRVGKIKHYGVSNYSPAQLDELLQVADENHMPRPVIIQPHYSLLKREMEQDLLPLCQQENIAVAPYRVLEGGMLTGKYDGKTTAPQKSRLNEKPEWMPEVNQTLFDQLQEIKSEAAKENLNMTEYAIQWTLSQPGIVSLVLGIKHKEQLSQAIKAASL
jgi:aryl-alcohol dehydrogenase-like predicted oxidoreductase